MSVRSTTLTDTGRGIRNRLLAALVGFVIVVCMVLIAQIFDRTTAVDGEAGSSYVTTGAGVAALFETLERLGGSPDRLRAPAVDDALVGYDTYVVLESGFQGYAEIEAEALARFAKGGGVVVIGGTPSRDLIGPLLASDPDWESGALGQASPAVPLAGVATVTAGRFGHYPSGGTGLPTLVAGDETLTKTFSLGNGLIHLVADIDVFTNQSIEQADNARFAVLLLGTGRVLFDEYRHGYSDSEATGLISAVPGRWGTALRLSAVSILAGLAVYGRRFGPSEPARHLPAPERRVLLESVTRTLRRSRRPIDATEPTRRAVRRRVAEKAGLGPHATETELRAAAAVAGLRTDEIEAVFAPSAESDSVLLADRALARLTRTPSDQETV